MTEPTTANEYQDAPWLSAFLADGQQISLAMYAYLEKQVSGAAIDGRVTNSIVPMYGAVRMADMSRYGPGVATAVQHGLPIAVNATNYVTGDVQGGATADIFTVRSVDPGAGFDSPGPLITLQTQDGLYWTFDNSGYLHAAVNEDEAAVFGYDISTARGGGCTFYPVFLDYAAVTNFPAPTTLPPPPPTTPPYRSFMLGFVQPTIGGGLDDKNVPVPLVANGPILLQQVQINEMGSPFPYSQVPEHGLTVVTLMTQDQGDLTIYSNGQRFYSPNNYTYLVIDGQMREVPFATGNSLFNFTAPSSIYKIPVSFWSEIAIGSPLSNDTRLIQAAGQSEVYLELDGVKRYIESPAVLQLYNFSIANIQTVTDVELRALPSGPALGMALDWMPYRDGTRINDVSNGIVYLVLDGMLMQIPNPATYNNLFIDWNGLQNVPSLAPLSYRFGPMIGVGSFLAQDGDGKYYLVINGVKRWIASPAAMTRFYFDAAKVQVVPALALDIPQGADIDY